MGDLSAGGNVLIWYSLTWSLSLYTRTNDRIRRGIREPIIIHILATGTLDEIVIKALQDKKKKNQLLLSAIKGINIEKNNNG